MDDLKFIYLLIFRYGQPENEVEKYVEKISSADDKYDFYMDLRSWQKAADVAVKMKDEQRLIEVFSAHVFMYKLIIINEFARVMFLRLENNVTIPSLKGTFKINYRNYKISC